MNILKQDYYYNEHDENQVKKILKSKKKKRFKRRIRMLFVLGVFFFIGFYFMSDLSKVKSIEVKGNVEVKTETVIKQSSLTKDTFYMFINKSKVVDKIKDMGMIKRVDVSVDLLGNVVIEIEEGKKVAYCEIGKKTYVIDELGNVKETNDKKLISSLQSCPRFLGFKDEKFLKEFSKEYVQVQSLIRNQTSDIIHDPKKADETRMKFILDCGKILYVRVEDMVDQLNNFDYEANIVQDKRNCTFSFEGKYVYKFKKCE